MSIITEITRITGLRNRIRTKLISLGILNDNTASLEDCTEVIEGLDAGQGELIYASVEGSVSNEKLSFNVDFNSFNNIKTIYIYCTRSSTPVDMNILSMFYLYRYNTVLHCWIITDDGLALPSSVPFSFTMSNHGYVLTFDKPHPPYEGANYSYDNFTYLMRYTYTNGPVNTTGQSSWNDENDTNS